MKTMYKGFDKNMRCKGYKYEVGKDYTEERAELCSSGFHACENPFDVWSYYDVVDGRFAEVELDDITEERHNDSKRCGKKIKINAEIGISGIVNAAVETLLDSVEECKDEPVSDNGGDLAKIGSSGNFARIGSSGDLAQIGSSGYGDQIGSSGNFARIGSSGNFARIGSSGDLAQIGSSGDLAQIGSSGYGAYIGSSGDYARIGSNGTSADIGSSGDYARIGSSGNYANVGSCGDDAKIGSSGRSAKIGSSGNDAVIAAIGVDNMVKAKKGSWITLAEYAEDKSVYCVKTEQVDGEKIKENVYYKLINGEFKEVD